MAGLIRVNENKSWSTAGWVFDHVLRQSIPYVPVDEQRLLSALGKGMIEGVGYINLSALPPADKQVFLRALRDGLRHAEECGRSAFGDPAFYPGFIDQFGELINMLSSDLKESD